MRCLRRWGHHDEAVRIATNVRILLHDTKRQVSLLSHLRARHVDLLTTVRTEPPPANCFIFEALLIFDAVGHRAKLDSGSIREFVPADQWWSQTVLVQGKRWYSRRDVVLNAADKDGGAHVDKALTPEYEALMRGFWFKSAPGEAQGAKRLTNHQHPMIRQMGHELLHSGALRALCE